MSVEEQMETSADTPEHDETDAERRRDDQQVAVVEAAYILEALRK